MKDKIFVNRHGEIEEIEEEDMRRHIRFPVCLAVKYGEEVPYACADFTLNISKGGVFLETTNPLEKGTRVVMHFYIPPKEKLLAEITGEVVGVNSTDARYPKGMHIKFVDTAPEELAKLEDYLEERRHLVDKEI